MLFPRHFVVMLLHPLHTPSTKDTEPNISAIFMPNIIILLILNINIIHFGEADYFTPEFHIKNAAFHSLLP
jgi:hypothetical protein